MAYKSIAAALKNNYNSQMKITYKGSTYQELLDLTGDKGKTSFEVPASETELIEFVYQSGYVDEDDCDWHEDKLSFDIPSWCKFSHNSWEIDEDGWGEDEDKDYWDWKKTVETLYPHKPEHYETLMYLTACQWVEGDWDDEEINSKRCKEEIEPILPLVKQLYKYNNSIDS